MFTEAHLHIPHPGTALITNSSGTQVILANADGKIHFQLVTEGRNFGQTIEITQGLRAGQQVVSTPSACPRPATICTKARR